MSKTSTAPIVSWIWWIHTTVKRPTYKTVRHKFNMTTFIQRVIPLFSQQERATGRALGPRQMSRAYKSGEGNSPGPFSARAEGHTWGESWDLQNVCCWIWVCLVVGGKLRVGWSRPAKKRGMPNRKQISPTWFEINWILYRFGSEWPTSLWGERLSPYFAGYIICLNLIYLIECLKFSLLY